MRARHLVCGESRVEKTIETNIVASSAAHPGAESTRAPGDDASVKAEPNRVRDGSSQIAVPVVEERLEISKHKREAQVNVRVIPRSVREVAEVPLLREAVEVTRVPVDRQVAETMPPRQEGDVTIVPVYEEVVIVEKRLMLKEELHIRTVRQTQVEMIEATVRKEEVEITREGK
jgi:uncharacterized protein (TIGR02271 family)